MYEIGTVEGSRSNLYSRNRFTICNELSVIAENVPQTKIFSKEAVPKRSNLFGCRYDTCNCLIKCITKIFKCKAVD